MASGGTRTVWVDAAAGGADGCIVKSVRLEYFAILRDQAGTSAERVETDAHTAAALYEELRERHRFKLELDRLRVAINGDFCPIDAPLADGDEVVFIPPVAGG